MFLPVRLLALPPAVLRDLTHRADRMYSPTTSRKVFLLSSGPPPYNPRVNVSNNEEEEAAGSSCCGKLKTRATRDRREWGRWGKISEEAGGTHPRTNNSPINFNGEVGEGPAGGT